MEDLDGLDKEWERLDIAVPLAKEAAGQEEVAHAQDVEDLGGLDKEWERLDIAVPLAKEAVMFNQIPSFLDSIRYASC